MNIWKIAWRSVRQRRLPSLLTAFSMALGVTLVVAVVTIHGVVTAQFRNNATLGYNMIVGAKGGNLQLTLNSVYYLSKPVENISYPFYLEFFDQETRDERIRESYAYQAHEAAWRAAELASACAIGPIGPWHRASLDALKGHALRPCDMGRDGRFANYVAFVIPLCMGDYFGPFRVVGTTPDMFDVLPEYGRPVVFEEGRNFREWTPENGYFEAVVGATVARERKVRVGDDVNPAHGDPEGHSHENAFRVVGVLKPTGTPNDRAVFVNMEGFLLMADHAKPVADAGDEDGTDAGAPSGSGGSGAGTDSRSAEARPESPDARLALRPLPLEQREVTAVLVRTVNPFVAAGLQNVINEGDKAMVVQPIAEIYNLLDLIVTPVQRLLLLLTVMIICVSGVSILVSIYNSMSERRHEIAVMRALGASRVTVMLIILSESCILSLGGGAMGWLIGHGLNWTASSVIEERTGVAIGFWSLAPPVNPYEFIGLEPRHEILVWPELLLIPLLVVLAIGVGILPAVAAYRADVAESLGK
ncbi:MAG: ABC transporter permease [Planctomycetes bacterium]|nr:ABC transporter permease [Planctomycetota bacterium]